MAIAFLAFHPALSNKFAYDDEYIVVHNPRLTGNNLTPLSIWTSPYWSSKQFPGGGLYRPLPLWTYTFTQKLNESRFVVDHTLNVLLHGGVGILLFYFLLYFKIHVFVAWLLTSLYLAHPIHTEVVSSLVGRADLLAALFSLAAYCVILAKPIRLWLKTIALFVFPFFALLSKETAVTICILGPVLFMFKDHSKINRRTFYVQVVAMFAATFTYLCLRYMVLHHLTVPDKGMTDLGTTFWNRTWNALAYFSFYFQKFFFPFPLLPDYSSGAFESSSVGYYLRIGFSLLVLSAATFISLYYFLLRKIWPPLFIFSALLFLVAILPVSNLIITIGSPFAERFLYYPSIFLILSAGDLISWLINKRGIRALHAISLLSIGIISVFLGVSMNRSQMWKDSLTLFRQGVADSPTNFYLQLNLGTKLMERGNIGEARSQFQKALNLRPNAIEPCLGLGKIEFDSGHFDEALRWYIRATSNVRPEEESEVYFNIFHVYRKLNQRDSALETIEKVIHLNPRFTLGREAYAKYLLELGRPVQAADQYEILLAQDPANLDYWQASIVLDLTLGRKESGLRKIQEAPHETFTPGFRKWLSENRE